jgi:CRP-like cAMP-binding protein
VCADSGEGTKSLFHHQRKIQKDSLVWYDNGEEGCLLVIRSGLVAISRCSQEGAERILEILGQGQGIGQMMVFNPSAQPLLVRACTEVEICEFPRKELEKLVQENAKIAESLIRSLSANCWALEQQIETLLIVSARERIKQALLSLAWRFGGGKKGEVELPFTHDDLSRLVGLNRVTVTRILKELEEKEGVLKRGHCRLTVRVDALKWAGDAHLDKSRSGPEAGDSTTEWPVEGEPTLEDCFLTGIQQ